MNKFVTISLSFTAGAVVGFAVGQFISIERGGEETKVTAEEIKKDPKVVILTADPAEAEGPKDDDPEDLVSTGPAHVAKPSQPGVNYTKVQKIVKENGYTTPEEIQQVIDDPDNEETYEEMEERELIERTEAMAEYKEKNKNRIVPIQKDEWDTDFPETDYDHKDLYYFTTDNILTDEDGNIVDEEEFIGSKPRQFGWMENDEERIYIRNHPKETDFQVWKEKCASTDWWA